MGSEQSAQCSLRLNTSLTEDQRERWQNLDVIRKVLRECRSIAMVGLSADRQKASFFTASYMQYWGYKIIPVNPRGGEILGEKVFTSLEEIPFAVDIVNAFRPSAECESLAVSAVKIKAKALWLQLRIINFKAADLAAAAGLDVIMDKCVKMEHGRFSGGLHAAGFNTEIITSRRAR